MRYAIVALAILLTGCNQTMTPAQSDGLGRALMQMGAQMQPQYRPAQPRGYIPYTTRNHLGLPVHRRMQVYSY